jgi:hypothetical protein
MAGGLLDVIMSNSFVRWLVEENSHMRNARNVTRVIGCALSLQLSSPGVALMSAIVSRICLD